MPTFTPKTVNDPSTLTHGRHPAFLVAIVEEAIPEGWEMGKKDTHMFRWHLAIWEHPDHLAQYAPEQQSAISSRAFSPKGKFQASKAYVWACALLGKDIPRGQGVDLDPLLPLACWADVARTPGNDYAKIEALWGRPEGQTTIPPVVHQLKAQYATGLPEPATNGQPAQQSQPPASQWGTPGPAAAYTVSPAGVAPQTQATPPAGWPGAARPAQGTQAHQGTRAVCQQTRIDPVTGQPGGLCGETATGMCNGHPVCAAHQAPAVPAQPPIPGAAQQGTGNTVPF